MHLRAGSGVFFKAPPPRPISPPPRPISPPANPPPPRPSSPSQFESGSLATGTLVSHEQSDASVVPNPVSEPGHTKSRSISITQTRRATATSRKNPEIPILLQNFTNGAWDREVFYGLENAPEKTAVTPSPNPPVPGMPLYDLLLKLQGALPQSGPLATLNTENVSLPNDGNLRFTVRRLELLLEVFVRITTEADGMTCCCDATLLAATREKKTSLCFNPSRNFGLTNLVTNTVGRPEDTVKRGPYDCLLLVVHAFLFLDGPDHLASLLRSLERHTDTLADYVQGLRENALEWGLKVLWAIDEAQDALATCHGAASMGVLSTKTAWWQYQALGKTIALLDSPPICVFETLFEALSGRIQTPRDRVSGHHPFSRAVRFRDTEALNIMGSAWQRSGFDQLEQSLQYLIHCIGRVENLLVILRDNMWYRNFIPMLLTGGAHVPQNLRLRATNNVEAQYRVDLVIKLTVSICIIILHASFMEVTSADDQRVEKPDVTRASRRKSSLSQRFSSDKPWDKMPDDPASPPLRIQQEMYSAVLLSFFDSIEAIALWTPDTVVLQRILLEALLTKVGHETNVFRQDCTAHIWENLFQLCFVLENFIFYSPVSDDNLIRPMAERHFTDPGIHGNEDVPLVTSLVELLQGLRVETLTAEVYDNVLGKKKCNYVKKRTLEELLFWQQARAYLSTVGTMDQKALKKSKAYKVCENALRQRRNGYRQMRKEMLGAMKDRKRPQAVRAAPPIPKLEVQQTFHEADVLETTVKKFSNPTLEQSFWNSSEDSLFKKAAKLKKRHDSRSRSKKSRSLSTAAREEAEASAPQGYWAGRRLRRISPQSLENEQKIRQYSELKRRQSDESSGEENKQAHDLENDIIGYRDYMNEEKSSERISFRDFLKETRSGGVVTDFDDMLCSKPDSEEEEDPMLWLEDTQEIPDEEEPLPAPNELKISPKSMPRCAWCGAGPSEAGFHAVDQQPFCKDCRRLQLVCAGCGGRFVENNMFTRATIPALFEGDEPVTLLYHASCFVCAEDKKPFDIVTEGTYPNIRGNAKQLYCLDHHNAKFGRRCAHCNEVIEKVTVWCLERTWHPEHLLCSNKCGARLNEHKLNIPTAKEWARMHVRGHPLIASYRTRVGFCESCYERDVMDVCKGCKMPFELSEEAVLVSDGERNWCYHMQCYKCVGCATQSKEQMAGRGLTYHQNLLLCAGHLQAAEKRVMPDYCNRCLKPLEKNSGVRAYGGYYHEACLTCSKCHVQLDVAAFAGANPPVLMLCPPHLETQLQGSSCEMCFEPIVHGTAYKLNGGRYHAACVVCYECKVNLGAENAQVRVSPPHAPGHLRNAFWCSEHFMKQFNPFCNVCGERIQGTVTMLGAFAHHRSCLRCQTCKNQLEPHAITECRGMIYCQEHILPALIKAASLGHNVFRTETPSGRVVIHGLDLEEKKNNLPFRKPVLNELSSTTSSPASEDNHPLCLSPSAETVFHDMSTLTFPPSTASGQPSTPGPPPPTATSGQPAPTASPGPPPSAGSGQPPCAVVSGQPPSTVASGQSSAVSGQPPSTVASHPPSAVASGQPPSTVASHPPSAITSGQPPSAVTSGQPSTASGQPPSAVTSGQPPTASGQPPPAVTSGQPPPAVTSEQPPATAASTVSSPQASATTKAFGPAPSRPAPHPSSPLVQELASPSRTPELIPATPSEQLSPVGTLRAPAKTPPIRPSPPARPSSLSVDVESSPSKSFSPITGNATPALGVAKLVRVASSLQTVQSVLLPVVETVVATKVTIPEVTSSVLPSPRPTRPAPQRPPPASPTVAPGPSTPPRVAHIAPIPISPSVARTPSPTALGARSVSELRNTFSSEKPKTAIQRATPRSAPPPIPTTARKPLIVLTSVPDSTKTATPPKVSQQQRGSISPNNKTPPNTSPNKSPRTPSPHVAAILETLDTLASGNNRGATPGGVTPLSSRPILPPTKDPPRTPGTTTNTSPHKRPNRPPPKAPPPIV